MAKFNEEKDTFKETDKNVANDAVKDAVKDTDKDAVKDIVKDAAKELREPDLTKPRTLTLPKKVPAQVPLKYVQTKINKNTYSGVSAASQQKKEDINLCKTFNSINNINKKTQQISPVKNKSSNHTSNHNHHRGIILIF